MLKVDVCKSALPLSGVVCVGVAGLIGVTPDEGLVVHFCRLQYSHRTLGSVV